MDEQALFKTRAFGGFEKQDVLRYIDEMNQQAKENQSSLEKKLEEMTAARSDLSRQVASFEEKITTLEEQLRGEREKISELTGVINGLNQELATQKRLTADRDQELVRERDRGRQLQFRAESLEYKSRKYDETTMKVGSILVEAQQSADRVLAQAQQSADTLLQGAQEEAQRVREETERSVSAISQEIDGFRVDVTGLRQSIVEVMSAITQRIGDLERSIDEIDGRCKAIILPETEIEMDGETSVLEVVPAQEIAEDAAGSNADESPARPVFFRAGSGAHQVG